MSNMGGRFTPMTLKPFQSVRTSVPKYEMLPKETIRNGDSRSSVSPVTRGQ